MKNPLKQPLVFLIAVTLLSHGGFVASRITVSLDAIAGEIGRAHV